MIAGIDEKDLEVIWMSICNNQEVPCSLSSHKLSLQNITQILTTFHRTGLIGDSIVLSTEDRNKLMVFLQNKQQEQKVNVSWNINVIVGEGHRSGHPIIDMTIDETRVEMDMETLAATRLALSKALLSTEKYV